MPVLKVFFFKFANKKRWQFLISATHQSDLDLLTDVFEEFLQKISYQLRCACDDEENDSFDFPVIKNLIKSDFFVNLVFLESNREGFGWYRDGWSCRASRLLSNKGCKVYFYAQETL